jgi:hypothetical protein
VRLHRPLLAACAALAVALVLPASAFASRNAEASIMDDVLLLGRSQAHIDKQMALFVRLGVDRVRVSAFWNGNAPRAGKRTKPDSFDGANQADPRYRWAALDRVVFSAARHRLKVMLSITTPGPLWGMTGKRRNSVWRPDPAEFGAYAEAVARRYGPFVDHYGISNEPNQGAWLQPQSDSGGLIAPHVYRDMVRAAYPRIKRADAGSLVLIANLAPGGTTRRGRRANIRPLTFLREMACVNRRYQPISRGSCRNFRPIPADAVGHHPYQFFNRPSTHLRVRDEIHISNARALLRALDRLRARGRVVAPGGARLDVYFTEFGYQTFPPDPFSGVSLRQQSRWLQEAAYLVWKTPRVRELNQFRLTDGPITGRGFAAFKEFQTGLLFASRRKKPSYRSYPDPFVISGRRFWGQVRPGGAHSVQIQFRASRHADFGTVRNIQTDARGYFRVTLNRRRGQWRYRYADGPTGKSDTLTLH